MINGLLMVISFFFCRVMLFPMLFWWYSSMTGLSLITVFFSLPLWVHLGVLGLWTPQLMWFNKMLRGSIKVIKDGMARMEDQKKQKKQKKPIVVQKSVDPDDSDISDQSEEQLCQKLD